MYTVKPVYCTMEMQVTKIIFCCRQVLIHTGACSLDLWDCESVPLMTGFCNVQVPFNTGFTE